MIWHKVWIWPDFSPSGGRCEVIGAIAGPSVTLCSLPRGFKSASCTVDGWQAEALAALEGGDRADWREHQEELPRFGLAVCRELRGTCTRTISSAMLSTCVCLGNEIVGNPKETSEQICCNKEKQQQQKTGTKQWQDEAFTCSELLEKINGGFNKCANVGEKRRHGNGKLPSLRYKKKKVFIFKEWNQKQTGQKHLGLVNLPAAWLLVQRLDSSALTTWHCAYVNVKRHWNFKLLKKKKHNDKKTPKPNQDLKKKIAKSFALCFS